MTAVHEPSVDWGDLESDPCDLPAERAVLGAMLQSEQAVTDVAAILDPDDFYGPQHPDLYRTIVTRHTDGKPAADVLLVLQDIISNGLIGKLPNGGSYLHDLVRATQKIGNAAYYARIVRDRAVDRRVLIAGRRLCQLGRSPRDAQTKAALAADLVAGLDNGRDTDEGPRSIGDCLPDVLRQIEEGITRGPSTGLADLDALTYGLSPGLWVIGARPGMGKTVLLTDIARSLALRQNLPALLFSMEMKRAEIITRILAAETGIPLHVLKKGGNALTADDWVRLTQAQTRLAEAPLFIDETTDLSAADVAARVRREHARRPLTWVGVDYLQLLRAPDGRRHDSREQEIAASTRYLKVVQGDLGINVTVAAQLNRGPEQRTDKRPVLSDLRESGSIEANANVAILLHRPDYYDPESPRAGEVDLIVAKNRDGAMDTITAAAQLHLSRFVDMAVV